jgi:hypothetical protein
VKVNELGEGHDFTGYGTVNGTRVCVRNKLDVREMNSESKIFNSTMVRHIH